MPRNNRPDPANRNDAGGDGAADELGHASTSTLTADAGPALVDESSSEATSASGVMPAEAGEDAHVQGETNPGAALDQSTAPTEGYPGRAKSWARSAAQRTGQAGRHAVEAMRNHPVRSALAGVGVAAVAWWLIARRRRS